MGFTYVARKKCGCVVGLCADYGNAWTAKNVAEFIKAGCQVERYDDIELKRVVFEEKTFFKCPHEDKGRQLNLLKEEE